MTEILKKYRDLPFSGQTLELFYDQNQVMHGKGEGENAFAFALGYAHGKERAVQIGFFQALIRGKLSSWLKTDQETLEADRFLTKLGFYYQARKEVPHIEGAEKEYITSYCDGLNKGRKDHYPFELKILGLPYHPWVPADSFALMKVMGYLGLSQTQQDFEKFLCMSLSKGISPAYFKSLFPNIDQLGLEEIILPLQKTFFDLAPVPSNHFLASLPKLKASNNWVIGPEKSETGSAIMASDPHLEINRLPALWYEFAFSHLNDFKVGITIPGVPGIVMGRNKSLSFSFTYGYMDTIDYFVEEVQNGKIKEDDSWVGLSTREEILETKSGKNEAIKLFECERGLLEVPNDCIKSNGDLKDGFYLSRAWSGHKDGCVSALKSIIALNKATTCQEGSEAVRDIFFSCNWLFADSNGDTAFQQSGYLPKRNQSGLYPLLGWNKKNTWKDHKDRDGLLHKKGERNGILVTANDDIFLHQEGQCRINNINLPLGSFRFDRINEFFNQKEKVSLMESKALQNDVQNTVAKKYLEIIRDHIPDTPSGRLLTTWDFSYDINSRGAFLFEKFKDQCYKDLISPVWGEQAWETLRYQTVLLSDYGHLWDRVLLDPTLDDAPWFNSRGSNKVFENVEDIKKERHLFLLTALNKTLADYPVAKCYPWGEVHQFTFSHIIFGKVTPSWFPCNSGPHPLKGCNSTVHQGTLFNDRGRDSSFAPSWRMVTDMAQGAIYTALPGGPSDRIFRKSYKSDISNWLQGSYKTVLPH
jgi:penicillin amidase